MIQFLYTITCNNGEVSWNTATFISEVGEETENSADQCNIVGYSVVRNRTTNRKERNDHIWRTLFCAQDFN